MTILDAIGWGLLTFGAIAVFAVAFFVIVFNAMEGDE